MKMKQVIGKIVIAVLAVTMMFGMTFVMTGCDKGSDPNAELRELLADLQDRINDLEERIEALEEENAALRKELEELQGKLEEMKNEQKNLQFREGFSGIRDAPRVHESLIGATLIRNHYQLIAAFENSVIFWEKNIPIWERYDSEFFKNYALVVYVYGKQGGLESPQIIVRNMQVVDGNLNLFLTKTCTMDGTGFRIVYIISTVLEVRQNDVAQVANVETDVKVVPML